MNINDLIKKYDENKDYYQTPKYNETQLRTDFLNPFFELLGWDIRNTKGKPTNEREVLLEEGLKEDTYSTTKKPDYTFRLFSERKFFLEAKKPSVKIESDEKSAKQVRRYGFTAKLKISVLSNFEYLSIYDCSQKVEATDLANNSRIKLYHYSEYEEKFEEIKQQLSYEIVYNGVFDEIWKDIEAQLERFSVDKLFLKQINDWRILLGKEIYSHKQDLTIEELNDIVQSYINSIVFLRVCEDRDLETYKTLLNYADKNDFNSLINKFKESDKKYNAGLFNLDFVDEIISNNSSSFWTIIKQLYFPESTYSFSVFASDILGSIYEIFLAEQLNIIDNEVLLIKKAEHIDRDIVTTPTFIIQDILRKTVVKHCEDKSDEEILNSTFADIACGSGAFLLEVYQLLHDILVDYYIENNVDKLIQISINTYKLPFDIKKQILKNCIFGVDKDFNAVEATKFGLLLKLLENENNSSITIPVLPSLEENIYFGNSLISSNETDDANIDAINPFDFFDTKFDVIVGNPPYMSTEDIKEFTPLEKPIFEKIYQSAYKQYDKYFLFIEQGINLLKENGYFGYIVPSKFIKVTSGKKLRKFISDNNLLDSLISFGSNQVFNNKTTYTNILILGKKKNDKFNYVSVNKLNEWKAQKNITSNLVSNKVIKDDNWVLIPPHLKNIYDKIISNSILLKDLVLEDNIINGIQTSSNTLYIHLCSKLAKEDSTYYYIEKDKKIWKIEKELTKPYYQTTKNDTKFNTFRDVQANSFVIYPYKFDSNGNLKLVSLDDLKANYNGLYSYFTHYKEKLVSRDISPEANDFDWYKFGRSQHLTSAICESKIIVGVLSNGYKYSIDYNDTFVSSGGTAGYAMIKIPSDSDYSIYYIQALLSSKYLEWFAYWYGEIFRGNFVARGTKILKKLPIIKIDFSSATSKKLHDNISNTQKDLNNLQTRIDKNNGNKRKQTPLQRQFRTKKQELENLLKELYDLKDKDNLILNVSDIYAID
ncbi:Eco57I restriction-modification methylase domain-containing protein [Halarcobacter ebronensis]|uniref:site-specific DNA-methyltransferase (adenine-specific) n=1 Tax=Halarcobacter ebronensis TaxID=1462615 RepID=A0A4Q1AQN3_9BACT|nr:Eco57I restriction-modification methylase domain-containing protein [Halarcobacter ebronensis]QKF82361.1 type II restriction/modification system, restriction endonuclease [Halarcobacter ebronensis]RXK07612.1 adenine methyltransferase [Halarcobacter ebronensis]